MDRGAEKPKKLEDDDEENDIISKVIGEFGRWQLKHTFLLSLFNIPCTWHIFVPTFHSAERPTWCARTAQFKNVAPNFWKNRTQPDGHCFIRNFSGIDDDLLAASMDEFDLIKCTNWEFEGQGQTIISEFSLLCDRKSLRNLAEMVFLAGVALGGLLCGILSDKYGRKRTLMASVLLQTILGTVIAFAPWFSIYVILRAALGFISVSVVFSGFVLAIEIVGGKWRTISGISYLFPVSLSYMMIAGIAYLITDWRQLQLAVSLPGILFLALWWVLPESPRWLLALGRTKEVMTILEEAAKTNGRVLPHNLDKQLMPVNEEDEVAENVGVMDLFKTKSMRWKTFILFLIWFSMYLVYYGLMLNLGNIGGNLYINSVLAGAVEIPAVAVSILILLKGGRRWPLALTMIISGVAAGISVPISALTGEKYLWMITTLTMISKLCISSSNAITPVFTAELYPTTIRNIGVGAANVAAGIALMLVPYLWELESLHQTVPMSLITAFGVIGGASVLLLPETGSQPLPDTVKDNNSSTLVDNSERRRRNNA